MGAGKKETHILRRRSEGPQGQRREGAGRAAREGGHEGRARGGARRAA